QDFKKLAPVDQLGLMGDTWAESMAGLEPVSDFLDMAKAVPADAAPEIWAEVAESLEGLDQYYRGDKARQDRFRAYAVAQLKPAFARVGWDAKPDESTSTTLLRTQLIGALSELGDADMLKEVRRRYDAQATDPKAVPAALRKTILAIVAQHALDLALTAEPGATNSAGMIRGVSWRHPEMAYDFAMAHRAQVDKLVDS